MNLGLIELKTLEHLNEALKSIQASPNLESQDVPVLKAHLAAIQSVAEDRVSATSVPGQSQQVSKGNIQPDEYLTVQEAANLIRVSKGYLYGLIRERKFSAVHVGKRQYRIRKSDVLNWNGADSDRKPFQNVRSGACNQKENYLSNHKSPEEYENRVRGPRKRQSVN